GLHVARLAGVPKPVLARAAQVLAALEERARGLDPLSDELPLFAGGANRPTSPPALAVGKEAVAAALAALDLDALSPREAQEALYGLKSLLDGAFAAPQEGLRSRE
ncbi:MAG: DNA mismatch repair protein MutS, partial [Acetobacteraceae bacterium]|nr:DNA mismatch repair protein MutS [Acetobacteraceae bacterium]